MLELVLAGNYRGLHDLIVAKWQSLNGGDIRREVGSGFEPSRSPYELELLYQYAKHFETLELAWRVREAFRNALKAERLSGSRLRRDHICQALEDSDLEFFDNWRTVARVSMAALPTFFKSRRLLRALNSESGPNPGRFQFRGRSEPNSAVIEGPAIGKGQAEDSLLETRVRVVFNNYSAKTASFGQRTIVFFADGVAERFIPEIKHLANQFYKTVIKSPHILSSIKTGLPSQTRKRVELIRNADDLLLANFYGPFALLGATYHLFASGIREVHIRNITFYALEDLDYSLEYGPEYAAAARKGARELLRVFRLHDPLGNFAFFKMLEKTNVVTFCPTGEKVIRMTGEEYAKRLDARAKNHDVPDL